MQVSTSLSDRQFDMLNISLICEHACHLFNMALKRGFLSHLQPEFYYEESLAYKGVMTLEVMNVSIASVSITLCVIGCRRVCVSSDCPGN